MLTQISSSVFSWTETHGAARNEPYPWNSFVIRTNPGDGLVLVDPLPISDEEAREVEAMGDPGHILLTCNYHLRESEAFRDRLGCAIHIHEDGLKQSDAAIDATFRGGDLLWNHIEVVHIPDAHYPEEVALLVRGDGNTMIVGDAVCGGRRDRGIPDGEIWINAPEFIADLSLARESLRKLASHSFDKMCFGHGSPITENASDLFNEFVENDRAWKRLASEKIERTNPDSLAFLRTMAARNTYVR